MSWETAPSPHCTVLYFAYASIYKAFAAGSSWTTDHAMSKNDISNTWNTYGVEYSAAPNDVYVQFYIKRANGQTTYGNRVNDLRMPQTLPQNFSLTKATPNNWRGNWRPSPPCGYGQPCTELAPFDNQMMLIINLAVGGNWGGKYVDNYSAFNGAGVTMQVKDVTVFKYE